MAAGTHPADPRRLGAVVGIAGGLVFVLANGEGIDGGILVVARALALGLAAWALARLFLVRRALGAPLPLRRGAAIVYLGAVAGMIALIALGRGVLASWDAAGAAPSWIAVCVGLHLLPFAWAFRMRMLTTLGIAVAATGTVGVAAGLIAGGPWGHVGAIVAGLVQLSVVAVWAERR